MVWKRNNPRIWNLDTTKSSWDLKNHLCNFLDSEDRDQNSKNIEKEKHVLNLSSSSPLAALHGLVARAVSLPANLYSSRFAQFMWALICVEFHCCMIYTQRYFKCTIWTASLRYINTGLHVRINLVACMFQAWFVCENHQHRKRNDPSNTEKNYYYTSRILLFQPV